MFRHSYLLTFIVFVLLITLMNSCIKDLPFEGDLKEEKLVINCIFYPYQKFTVRLTTARNILNPNGEIRQVSGATVLLRDEDGKKVLEYLEEIGETGVYISNKQAAFPGMSYWLEVSHPDFEDTFEAFSGIPKISDVSTLDTNMVKIDGQKALEISAAIKDLEKLNETYIFEVELKDQERLASLISNDQEVITYGDGVEPTRLFLNDQSFNGGEKAVEFFTLEGFGDGTNTGITEIRMLNASPELREYYKSLEEYNAYARSLNQSAIPPVKIFSNISRNGGDKIGNGLGIFAGTNVTSMVIKY